MAYIVIKLRLQWILLAVIVLTPKVFAADFGVGQREFTFEDTLRNRKIFTHVWYPIDPSFKSVEIAQGPFQPLLVSRNAPIASMINGKLPVVFLSHGSGGSAERLFWLADFLVHKGVMVFAVNHPGNMQGDNSGMGLMRVWERAKDFTFVVSQLMGTAEFKAKLDLDKLAVAGHSAGGTTALLLAGARLSNRHFTNPIPKCAGSGDPYYEKLCAQLSKINYQAFSKKEVEGNYADSRVKSVVALDPGFVRSMNPESLKAMPAKALVFIADHLSEPQDEIHSKEFVQLLPRNATEVTPNSTHMSFISACRPDVGKNDPELKILCSDQDRKIAIQKAVAEKTYSFFLEVWK